MATSWVLGARGFLGSHLVTLLQAQGEDVCGLGHGSWPAEASSGNTVTWLSGEINGSNLVLLAKRSALPDCIYFVAGGSSVGRSLEAPRQDFDRTVAAMVDVLEWMRSFAPASKLVVASSAAVYGASSLDYLPESGMYTPYSPYGYSKRMMELACESYARNFSLNISIMRLFSVFGPGLAKQLLWDVSLRLRAKPENLLMHGSGNELRDWLYIDDAVRLLHAASNLAAEAPMILNGGTGIGTPVRTIVDLLCVAYGASPELRFSGQSRQGDPMNLVADTSLSKRFIVSQPKTSLEDGIARYAQWFADQ